MDDNKKITAYWHMSKDKHNMSLMNSSKDTFLKIDDISEEHHLRFIKG